MEKLLLVSEVAEITHRSPSSVYNIAYRNRDYVHTSKENGRLYIYAQDVPFIDKYPRESKKARAEYQQRIDTQANIQFAEDFKAERMKLNKAKVPANVKQPFKQAPKQQAPAETLQLQDLGGGKYALPAGWKIENGTLVKKVEPQLPKSIQEAWEKRGLDLAMTINYREINAGVEILQSLLLIRDLYNDRWEAKWTGEEAEKQPKPNIFFDKYHKPTRGTQVDYPTHFVFKDTETRDAFYNNFQTELQTIAKLLM